MKHLFLIHEYDYDDKENSVIGVADSLENVELMINEYYGNFREISFTDIRDCNIEYSKVIELIDLDRYSTYKLKITIENIILNEI